MPTSTFAQKCHQMVSAGHSTIGWSREGDTIWVSNPERLGREHIPKYYDHSSYASWTRALHAHSFRKLTPSTWSHPSFHRDRPEAASTIVRKRPPHRGGKPAREEKALLAEPKATRVKRKDKDLKLLDTAIDKAVESLPPLTACAVKEEIERQATQTKAAAAAAAASADTLEAGDTKKSSVPTPEQAKRLAALKEQIIREKQLARQLKNMLEQLEANATRARREELQLRHSVVQLAQWIATTAMAPAVAATALATAGSFAARAASMSAAVTAKALSASPAGTATTAATAATGTVPAPPRVHTSCSAEANAEFELGELGEPPLLRIISSNTLMVASA